MDYSYNLFDEMPDFDFELVLLLIKDLIFVYMKFLLKIFLMIFLMDSKLV